MKTIICFMSGFGFQEVLTIVIFMSVFVGIPVLVILVVKAVLQRKPAPAQNVQTTSHPSDSKSSVLRHADQLKALKALQEKGIISAEEFESEKKKVLAS